MGGNPSEGCDYGGSLHPVGSTFPATDGCNSCSCAPNGEVACTLLGCLGDGGSACDYGGQRYEVGATFLSTDGCNSCSCSATGTVTCDARACSDGGGLCALDATYTFGWNGGFVAYVDVATLTAAGGYTYTRTPSGLASGVSPPAISCSPPMPKCGSGDAFDVSDVFAALADVDVQKSFLATPPPIYGVDSRPYDGSIFEVRRSTGGSFLVGGDCPSPALSSCRPIPTTVGWLVALLRALNDQQLADPSCENLR